MTVLFQIAWCFTQVVFYSAILCVSLWVVRQLLPKGKIGNYHNRYVLITGCDSGFGKETAIRLDKMGFHVFGTCLTREGEERLNAVCSSRLKTLHLDVTKSETIREAYNEVKKTLPSGSGLWGLVNNAGIGKEGVGPIEWLPLTDYKRCADVNLWGLIEVTKTFLPLIKQAKGRVTNLASMFGRGTPGSLSSYCISKYGVEAFSDALRREMNPFGVQVSILEPGIFKTAITDPDVYTLRMNGLWKQLSEDLKKDYGEEYLQKRTKRYKWQTQNGVRNPRIHEVVDAVIDSLTSRSPKTRYAVGKDSKPFIFISSWIPAELADWFMQRQFETQCRKAMNSNQENI